MNTKEPNEQRCTALAADNDVVEVDTPSGRSTEWTGRVTPR